MDSAFVDELKMRLCSDEKWDIKFEVKLPNMPSIWSKFDIGCYYDNELIGLIELSVKDTNVAHALHNGEVKLLGICQGVSVSNSIHRFLNILYKPQLQIPHIILNFI